MKLALPTYQMILHRSGDSWWQDLAQWQANCQKPDDKMPAISWNISCYWYIWYVLSIYLEYLTKHNPEQTAKSTLTNCLVWSVVSVLYQVRIWCNLLVKIFQAAKEKKTQECPVVLWKNIFYAENNLLVYLTAQTRLHCTCVFSSGCWKPTVRNGCYRHVLIRQRQRNNQTKGWPSTLL